MHRAAAIVATTACVVALSVPQSAWAARTFPQNSVQVRVTGVTDDTIIANGRSLHLPPGVLIFTTNNTTLVKGALPDALATRNLVRIQRDLNGEVRRIWLLADDEVVDQKSWWQFWKSDQLKDQLQQEQQQKDKLQ